MASSWRDRRLAILGLHGVSRLDEHEWEPDLYHSPEVLEGRLGALARLRCNVLPLAEALERLRCGALPPRAVVLTFDDGNRDFADVIWPRLRHYGMPATLYVSTLYVERRYQVFNACVRYLLWKGRPQRLDLRDVLPGHGAWDLGSPSARDALFWALLAALDARDASGAERDAVLRVIERRLGLAGDEFRERGMFLQLDLEQVAGLSRAGVDIQLHTHRHRFPDDDRGLEEELRRNRAVLERCGVRATSLAYPGGAFRLDALPVLEGNGIRSAVTCEPGLASVQSHALFLPRAMDSNRIPLDEFEACVSGLRALVPLTTIHASLPRLS